MTADLAWVLAETRGSKPTALTLELLTKACVLARRVSAVAWGPEVPTQVSALADYGATEVFDVGDIGNSLPGPPVSSAIAALFERGQKPAVLLFPATYDGRDIAGRLSAKTDLPLLTNVVELNNDTLETRHLLFGGSQVATARFTSPGPHLFVVRAKSFQAESRRFGDAEVIKAPVPDMGSTNSASIIERHIESATGPELEDARVIVSGGRGLGSAENYKLIEELARLLNGAAGATRAIVDAGWVPYSYQVGQTGKTVRPDVYIAWWNLGRDATSRRNEKCECDHCGKPRPRCCNLFDRRPKHSRRRNEHSPGSHRHPEGQTSSMNLLVFGRPSSNPSAGRTV